MRRRRRVHGGAAGRCRPPKDRRRVSHGSSSTSWRLRASVAFCAADSLTSVAAHVVTVTARRGIRARWTGPRRRLLRSCVALSRPLLPPTTARGRSSVPSSPPTLDHPRAPPRPPQGATSTATRETWSWTTTRPTTKPSTTIVRTGNTATSTSSLREQFTSFFQVSDNKLAMKLFGNKSALEKEKLRHKAVGYWIIHPCSDFRSLVHSTTLSQMSQV